ncbi:hypothetical protein [Micromonospora echinospora]
MDAGPRTGPATPAHRLRRRGSCGCLLDLLRPATASGTAARPRGGTVRHAVAGHPNLPVHVRRVLLADSSEWVEQAR